MSLSQPMSAGLLSTGRRCLALALSLVMGVACGDDNPVSPERAALDAAQARWTSVRPAANSYAMEQRVSCFCPTRGTSFELTIQAGAVLRARNLGTGNDAPVDLLSMFRSVDQLFAEVREALARPGTLTKVEYDTQSGYPSTVSLDPIKQAIDDEVTYFTRSVILPS